MTKLQRLYQKIDSTEGTKNKVDSWKASGEKVVFTNGCFDILHKGHVTYLAKAAELGNKLVVALNTDASVKAQNKGPERPINPEDARLLVLASLEFIDAVFLFTNDTPLEEIKFLQPDILVKGADYNADERDEKSKLYIVGAKEIVANGGKVMTIDLVEGFSTTAIIGKRGE
ncbi:MAG: rfaE bifunctional protein nucleotidyltransferase chain/domain [Psychromonas sp.]|jgi:rfaE bifunctional protein nucleotidyltransferase chain/domain